MLHDPTAIAINQDQGETPFLKLVNLEEARLPLPKQPEILRHIRQKPVHAFRTIPHRGISYRSFHEAACGELLERYVPNFKVILHQTYEVPVRDKSCDIIRRIDFYVNGILVEYHPPRFWRSGYSFGDFKNAEEFFAFRRRMKKCKTPEERRELKQNTQDFLHERYTKQRQKLAAADPLWRDTPLIVARDAGELYDKIITRMSPAPPAREAFIREFNAISRAVRRAFNHSENKNLGSESRRLRKSA